MRCPSLNEIRTAFFNLVQNALEWEVESGLVFLAAPAQANNPEKNCIIVSTGFTPGNIAKQELGGAGSLAKRNGIFKITVSSLPTEDADLLWDIADVLEKAFSIYSYERLPVNESGAVVYCEFPYTENIGTGPDNRNIITVTVPWWAWTQA